MIDWQDPPALHGELTAAEEVAYASLAGGSCGTIGFDFSQTAADGKLTVYLQSARASGVSEEQAIEALTGPADRFVAWFNALTSEVGEDEKDWQSPSAKRFVSAVTDFCLTAARRWPDIVISGPDAPSSEAEVVEALRAMPMKPE